MALTTVKHHTKLHTRCCIDVLNLLTMLTAARYHIRLLFTMYVDLDVMPADSSPKYTTKENSAQNQYPA